MDVAGLRDRIHATLNPNADIRRQAELDLKYVRAKGKSWIEACLTDRAHA